MKLAHANAVRHAFRRIVLACVLAPPAVIVVGCSGGVGPAPDTTADGGSGTTTTTTLPQCAAVKGPPTKGGCGWSVEILDFDACGFENKGSAEGPFLGTEEQCKQLCGHDEGYCYAFKFEGESPKSINCGKGCEGRRYDGLDDEGAPAAHDTASYLARLAFFEAASVDAFAILARELRRHGAPASLVRSCVVAGRDEVRHARMAKAIAKRHGADLHQPTRPVEESRTLEALAIENAVEGTIRETFGVIVGLWQAVHAPTKELRALFAKLAEDEARHAALAWRVDAWARAALDAGANARIDRARDAALDALAASLGEPPIDGLGLPSPADARVLFLAFVRDLPRSRITNRVAPAKAAA